MGAFNTVLSFYDIFGQRIATASCGPGNYCAAATAEVYFGAKLVKSKGVAVVTDRLGSVRGNASGDRFSYLPYGEERTITANHRVKFGTYLRDSTGLTSQDYADQRYYNPWFGRFNTADPSRGIDPNNPGTWNKYAYVGGDPVNANDPGGLFIRYPSDDTTLGGYGIGDNACEFISSSVALYGPNQGDPIIAYTHCLFPPGLAFAPAPQKKSPQPNWTMYVVATSDCYKPFVGKPEVWERDVTYSAFQLYDDGTVQQLTGDGKTIVKETLAYISGQKPPSSPSNAGDVFIDTISVGNGSNFHTDANFFCDISRRHLRCPNSEFERKCFFLQSDQCTSSLCGYQ